MTIYVFKDEAGNELARGDSQVDPALGQLELGDRFSDTNGVRMRVIAKEIHQEAIHVIVRPWLED